MRCARCPRAGARCLFDALGHIPGCQCHEPGHPRYDPAKGEAVHARLLEAEAEQTPAPAAPARDYHPQRLQGHARRCVHRGAPASCSGTATCRLGLRGSAPCGGVTPADCARLCGASLWAASRGLPAPGSASLRSASGER